MLAAVAKMLAAGTTPQTAKKVAQMLAAVAKMLAAGTTPQTAKKVAQMLAAVAKMLAAVTQTPKQVAQNVSSTLTAAIQTLATAITTQTAPKITPATPAAPSATPVLAPAAAIASRGTPSVDRDSFQARRGHGLSRSVAPSSPAPPASSGVQVGASVGSAAGGGSGFFFFGVATLFALAALLVPRVICTLRTFVFSHAPDPFFLLPERPG